MGDEYHGVNDQFDLMNSGPPHFGPLHRAECPALINPYYRVEKYHWAGFEELRTDQSGFEIAYDYDNPTYVKIASVLDSNLYFILENRRRTGFNMYTPNGPLVVGCGTISKSNRSTCTLRMVLKIPASKEDGC
jgi:hypothetical protein